MGTQNLRNFARVTEKYFSAGISLDDQKTKLEQQKDKCSLLKDTCVLAEAMSRIPGALTEQKKILENAGISPNSWSRISYNTLCGNPSDTFSITSFAPDATNESVKEEARKTFDYMLSGKWKHPFWWVPIYERAIAKLQKHGDISKDSELPRIFREAVDAHK